MFVLAAWPRARHPSKEEMEMKKGLVCYSLLAVGVLIFSVGCTSQKPVGLTNIPTMEPVIKTVTVPGPSRPLPGGGTGGGIGGGNPIDPTGGGGTTTIVEVPPENQDIGNNFNSNQAEDWDMFLAQMVHFEFDSSEVRPDDFAKVQIVAQHMIQNPSHALVVGGHCDERGTEDYNLSLGERRALAVIDELVTLGVNPDKTRTISYGEKIPIADGTSEAIFAQNRRGEFVLLRPIN
jgi:peptidoglycan-associated lipoprotein